MAGLSATGCGAAAAGSCSWAAEGAALPFDDPARPDQRVAEASGGVAVEIVEDGPDLVEQPAGPVEPGVDLLEMQEVVVHRLGPLQVARS